MGLTLTDDQGNIFAEQSFDAWGRKRNPDTWGFTGIPSVPNWLYRGYTGHEHLPEFGLIHMNGRMYDPILGRMLSPDNYVHGSLGTQGFNRYSYAGNNPLKYSDPSGEIPAIIPILAVGLLLTTDLGYDIQKFVSPVAVHINHDFGTHGTGFGLDVSVGSPQVFPISYRYEAGATYYFNRVGGYGRGWQVRNGGEWGAFWGMTRYGGLQYRDYDSDGNLIADQVTQTYTLGGPLINLSFTNDTDDAFPFHDEIPGIPELRSPAIINARNFSSDRLRTASGKARLGLLEMGFFLHTGESTIMRVENGTRILDGGTIRDPDWSNGIVYFGFGPIKMGYDSEGIRHFLQNRVAHDSLSRNPQFGWQYPWVLRTNRAPRGVLQFGGF